VAITFQGSVVSYPICGNDLLTQNLLVVENGNNSRVNVIIRRLSVQNDGGITALTSVMPLVKTSRMALAASGGILLSKCPLDTSQSSSSEVKFWAPVASGTPVTATAGDSCWEQYINRAHTLVGQLVAVDGNLLPMLIATTGKDFIIKPGEFALVQVKADTVASNPSIGNNWIVQAVWEEDSLPTFAISGVVTLDSVPVESAKVIVIQADDEYLTNAALWEVKTTNVDGEWDSTILSGRVGAAFVQHEDGGDFYTAPGSPFLEE